LKSTLGWTQATLARKAKVGLSTLADFEREYRDTSPDKVARILAVLERADIKFVAGDVKRQHNSKRTAND
jgi:transcriptional regulator with XRE-family HTH domain